MNPTDRQGKHVRFCRRVSKCRVWKFGPVIGDFRCFTSPLCSNSSPDLLAPTDAASTILLISSPHQVIVIPGGPITVGRNTHDRSSHHVSQAWASVYWCGCVCACPKHVFRLASSSRCSHHPPFTTARQAAMLVLGRFRAKLPLLLLGSLTILVIFWAAIHARLPLWSSSRIREGSDVWEWLEERRVASHPDVKRPSLGALRQQGAQASWTTNLRDDKRYLTSFLHAG